MNNLLIGATASGAGKNTIACSIIRMLKNRGYSPVPFKPVTIERLPLKAGEEITPSIQMQSQAANIVAQPFMNPVRVVFSPEPNAHHELPPRLYLSGVLQGEGCSLSNNAKQINTHLVHELYRLQECGSPIIIEGAGALSDWIDTPTAKTITTLLNPKILLVADTLNGGGFSSAVGTMELMSQDWRSRTIAIVFNNIDGSVNTQLLTSWASTLNQRYHTPIVTYMPTLSDIVATSEDLWPLTHFDLIEDAIKRLSVVFEHIIGDIIFNAML